MRIEKGLETAWLTLAEPVRQVIMMRNHQPVEAVHAVTLTEQRSVTRRGLDDYENSVSEMLTGPRVKSGIPDLTHFTANQSGAFGYQHQKQLNAIRYDSMYFS